MRRHDSHHEHDPDIIECRECEAKFDLALQHYYDNLCPSCKEDDSGGDFDDGGTIIT